MFYIDFNPSIGHEQKHRRLAIILSHDLLLKTSRMAIVAPISTTKRNYPAYYELQETQYVEGKVLLDQTKALDLYHRKVTAQNFIERATPQEFKRIIHQYKLLFDLVEDYR